MPRLGSDNFADLDEVEYRDYKRELLRKSRAEGTARQSPIASMFLCALLFAAAGLVLLHHYGVLSVGQLNP